jgi:hypothetical protein
MEVHVAQHDLRDRLILPVVRLRPSARVRGLLPLLVLVGCRRQSAAADPCFAEPTDPLALAARFV